MNELTLRNKKRHVLLADDDSDDRDLFAEAVSFVDPTVKVTMKRDGEELMEFVLQNTDLPDLIFLDLNMPKKNGKECLSELQAEKQLHDIPVIIYTTSLNPVDIDEAFNKGAHRFFRKPNSFEELKEIVHTILFSEIATSSTRTREQFLLSAKATASNK